MESNQLNFVSSLVRGYGFTEREENIILSNLSLSNREIGKMIFRTEASIRQFLNKKGIRRSKFQLAAIRSQVAENQKGEQNPNWKNGSSKFPYRYKKSRAIKDKIKILAREKVRRAILKGKLIPQPCEVCGKLENIEAHHWDYSKPLEVNWLCKEHHIKADQQRRAIETNFTLSRYGS